MLTAHLRGKMERLAARFIEQAAQGDRDDELGWREVGRGDEDTLTSSVFERLAYLPTESAWTLLVRATRPLGDDPFPMPAPNNPVWSFWPQWSRWEAEAGRYRVEPDVVVEADDLLVVVEAKLFSDHAVEQWFWEVAAAKRTHPTRRVAFIAAGGPNLSAGPHLARDANRQLHEAGLDKVPMFAMSWESLRRAADELLSYWAWDFLPAYALRCVWQSAEGTTEAYRIALELRTDTGFPEGRSAEPDSDHFDRAEDSASEIRVEMWRSRNPAVSWSQVVESMRREQIVGDASARDLEIGGDTVTFARRTVPLELLVDAEAVREHLVGPLVACVSARARRD